MKIKQNQSTALKIAHIALGCLWLSGLVAMLICLVFPSDATQDDKIGYFHAIDEWMVIPCAVAAVITGLILMRVMPEYSTKPQSWLSIKLALCCSIMLGGYFFVKTPLLLDLVNFLLSPFSIQVTEYTLFLWLTILAIIAILVVFHASIVKLNRLRSKEEKSQESTKQRSSHE